MAIKIDSMPQRLATDTAITADLRAKFRSDPQAGLKAAAQQFESMFMQMVLKSMRDVTPQDGMLDSDQSRFYTTMLDQQLAQNMSTSGQLGFARLIEQQLGRNLQTTVTPEDALLPANAAAGKGLPLAAANRLDGPYSGRFDPVSAMNAAPKAAAVNPGGQVSRSAPPTTKEFVDRVWPDAVEASRSTGIPPQFLVAQAALESGWGKHEIRHADGTSSHNLFGIKAGKRWDGATVETATTEYVEGKAQKENAKFRAYDSYADAFRDYASLLRNNPRYGAVIGSQDGTEFARRLQQAGYATDPQYANKLASIINGPTLRQALIG
ncbi:MAG: Mannosyl-glycoprotein endo-beta-N-acetylglucosamidase [Proteobacteria bacterium]|nr:Mannosyl-glycoprotein endo-beta-N-acetylglucosamidase [Pseudomonadota bacterium]